MALAKRNEGAKISSDINVTPMVDVMLVLLIIFMVVTPMLQHGISVDMAQVNNPTPMADADKEDALLVSIMRNGDVFFGTDKITPENLEGLNQEQIDQIYARITAGPIPDGAFDGKILFPRGSSGEFRASEIAGGIEHGQAVVDE